MRNFNRSPHDSVRVCRQMAWEFWRLALNLRTDVRRSKKRPSPISPFTQSHRSLWRWSSGDRARLQVNKRFHWNLIPINHEIRRQSSSRPEREFRRCHCLQQELKWVGDYVSIRWLGHLHSVGVRGPNRRQHHHLRLHVHEWWENPRKLNSDL